MESLLLFPYIVRAHSPAAGGNEDVWFFCRDVAEALDQLAHAPGPSVITADIRFCDGVLETVQIEQLPVAINQVADESIIDAADLRQIRYRTTGISGRVNHFELDPAYVQRLSTLHGSSDWHPDIAVGRFSVRSAAHLQAVVDKTLYYQNGPLADPDYLKRAVFMAGNDNYNITEGTHNYVISTHMDPNDYISDKIYEVTYGGTTQDVSNAFNDGRFFAIFSGHGDTYYWADGPATEDEKKNAYNVIMRNQMEATK